MNQPRTLAMGKHPFAGILVIILFLGITWHITHPHPMQAEGSPYLLISRGYDGSPANGESWVCGVSADGRYVAFHSTATNIVASPVAPGGSFEATYLHDRTTGVNSLISINQEGTVATTTGACNLSADGNTVIFASASDDLPGDGNGDFVDVFAFDRAMGQTELISIGSEGQFGDSGSFDSAVSGEGRYVVFASYGTLVTGIPSGGQHIYLRDRESNTTTLVSVAPDGSPAAPAIAYHPTISRDGQYVAFASLAENLVPNDTNFATDIFLRDLTAATTTRLSVNRYGTQSNHHSTFPRISADGRYIAFYTLAGNLIAPHAELATSNVIIRDRDLTELYSVAWRGTVQGYGQNLPLGISADGQKVLFRTDDYRYDSRDTNNAFDIYLSTLNEAGNPADYMTVLPDGTAMQGASGGSEEFPLRVAFFSDDLQTIAFDSTATNIDPADTTPNSDVYLHLGTVGTSPSAVTLSAWQVTSETDSAVAVGWLWFIGMGIVIIWKNQRKL